VGFKPNQSVFKIWGSGFGGYATLLVRRSGGAPTPDAIPPTASRGGMKGGSTADTPTGGGGIWTERAREALCTPACSFASSVA